MSANIAIAQLLFSRVYRQCYLNMGHSPIPAGRLLPPRPL